MLSLPTILERAFQLAGDGSCRHWQDVSQILKRERFALVDHHLSGPAIRSQINRICARAERKSDGNY
ncbi:hypothetical protein [Sphingomonas crocodyli]|uniref:Uncharacterized protein n=1 Tax=Sphingomonas crocodyli TaxID=1979270 RepID=A0A437LYA5_9SPHN|nr:hypothetical protein [Sphingomonas crocodyli]RVT90419.1 hypothetical protein EOD43_19365 [Sphingomonas crocodyli]